MQILMVVSLAFLAALSTQERPQRQMRIPALVTAIAFAPDGESLVAWDPAGFSRLNIERGRVTAREPVFGKACGRAAVLPRSDDGVTIGAKCGGKLVLFEAATARPLGEWQSPQKRTPIAFTATADGKLVATVMAGALSTIDVSNTRGEAAAPALESAREVEVLTLSSSGQHLGAGAVGGVEIWQLPDGRRLHTISGGPAHAFHPDGRTVAVALDRSVGVFKVEDGTRIQEFEGGVSQVRFSPDGRAVVGWTNQQVLVWDAATGKSRVALKGDEFVAAAISPDGVRLATLSLERRGDATVSVVAIWRLP